MERIINIKIFKSGKLDMDTANLGRQNEKNVTKLVFSFPEELDSYNKTIEFSFDSDKKFTDIIFNNEYKVDNNISGYLNVDFQVVCTDTDGTEVFKSNVQSVVFENSINAVEPAPSPEDVSAFNSLITKLNESIEGVANISISAVKEDDVATITITKADGTEENFIVEDGKDYILTDEDKEEIVDTVKPMVEETIKPTLDNNLQEAKSYADSIKPTKTSELTNDSDFAKTNQNNNFTTSQTINGILTINGDIVQNGEQYETHAEKVYSKNDEIITRDGAVGGLSEGEYAGIQALLYDGENNGRLGFNAKGEARVGDIGDEQPLLTRDEIVNLQEGQVLVWDGTKLRAVGSDEFVKNTDYATQDKAGVIKYSPTWGVNMNSTGFIYVNEATPSLIDKKNNHYNPITPANLDYAVGTVKASETQSGTAKMWISTEDGETGLNISTEV